MGFRAARLIPAGGNMCSLARQAESAVIEKKVNALDERYDVNRDA